MGDLSHLIDHDIPEARQELEGSYSNLERVAAFCEASYLQAQDKSAALEATKRYTVQSLASVAYQINSLADNLLRMLDLQTEKMLEIEHQVNNIYQNVDIHKEKVARREIGVLAANKSIVRNHKIVAPANQEKPSRYARRKIDYGLLDDIGHGVRQVPRENPVRHIINRAGSTISQGSSSSGGSGLVAGAYIQPDGGQYAAGGRLYPTSRSLGKEYRSPVGMMATPGMAPGTSMSGAATLHSRYPHLVQTGDGRHQRGSILAPGTYHRSGSIGSGGRPAPPGYGTAPASMGGGRMVTQYEEHGMVVTQYEERGIMEVDDSLPPPPTEFMNDGPQMAMMDDIPPPPPLPMGMAPPHQANNRSAPQDFVPSQYIERVIAIYDYEASKPDELSFHENSLIYVINKNEDGWFEGVLDGVTGLFPGNYVEPI